MPLTVRSHQQDLPSQQIFCEDMKNLLNIDQDTAQGIFYILENSLLRVVLEQKITLHSVSVLRSSFSLCFKYTHWTGRKEHYFNMFFKDATWKELVET